MFFYHFLTSIVLFLFILSPTHANIKPKQSYPFSVSKGIPSHHPLPWNRYQHYTFPIGFSSDGRYLAYLLEMGGDPSDGYGVRIYLKNIAQNILIYEARMFTEQADGSLLKIFFEEHQKFIELLSEKNILPIDETKHTCRGFPFSDQGYSYETTSIKKEDSYQVSVVRRSDLGKESEFTVEKIIPRSTFFVGRPGVVRDEDPLFLAKANCLYTTANSDLAVLVLYRQYYAHEGDPGIQFDVAGIDFSNH